ncbi:MAG: hypothetical protein ACON5H_01165 [Akkermansiaceae bacterium]
MICALVSLIFECFGPSLPLTMSMHLRFSEEELATLVEMVSLATDVANINQTESGQLGYTRFEAIEHKILESAKLSGMSEIIEIDPARNKNRVTEKFQKDSYFQKCLEELRNTVFWEELMIRLTERDLIRVMGDKNYLALSEVERAAVTKPLEQRYWDKFVKDGLNPLHWIEAHEKG